MVDKQARIDELNKRMPGPFKLAVVRKDDLEFLEKNARYMKNETFQNLVNNIKKDGGLSSLPFCYLQENGKYKVLSGNHRAKAAIEAGLEEIPVLYTDKPLSKSEQISIQLSHNALVGEDDPVILRELYNEIEELDLKYYAGLDDKLLEQLEKVEIGSLSDVHLDYVSLSFLFLPDELQQLKNTLETALDDLSSDAILARFSEYDRFLDAQDKTKKAYNIHNGATALMIILDIFERHREDLRNGWMDEDGELHHNGWVPLASIFGTDEVPAEAAKIIHSAVEKMVSRQEISNKNKWQAIELMAADYLGGE